MPASRADSWRSASASTVAGKAPGKVAGSVSVPSSRSAAAMASAAARPAGLIPARAGWSASFQSGEAGFQGEDAAMETFDLSIARVRCSSSGRGPRRRNGPGASVRSLIARWRGFGARARRRGTGARHGAERRIDRPLGGPGPERGQGLPTLLRLPVGGERGELALPESNPVAGERGRVRSRIGAKGVGTSGIRPWGIRRTAAASARCSWAVTENPRESLAGGVRRHRKSCSQRASPVCYIPGSPAPEAACPSRPAATRNRSRPPYPRWW